MFIMKKLLMIVLSAAVSVSAGAQMFRGFSFDVNYANDGTRSAAGNVKDSETYGVALSPQLGWYVNDRLAIGARLSFNMKQTNSNGSSGISSLIGDNSNTGTVITRSIGWDVAPFASYKLFTVGKSEKIGVWAEGHAYLGLNYPQRATDFKQQYTYGVQVLPVVSYKINEKTEFLLHFAILSIGYAGTSTNFDDRTEYSNTALLFTGKAMGLFRSTFTGGLYGIKIGMMTKF